MLVHKTLINKIISNHILRKSLLTMIVQAAGQGAAFITAILLARHLSLSEYGYYIFGITVATILAVIATMGAGGMLARTWGKSNLIGVDRDRETFHVQNWYFKKGFLAIVLIIEIIVAYQYYTNTINYVELFALLFAIPFFTANILQSFFVAKRVVVLANLMQLGLRLIMLAATIYFIVTMSTNVSQLILSMIVLMFVYVAFIWTNQLRKFGFKSQKPIGSNLSFAMMQWGLLLLSQIDILILKGMSTSSNVALYGVALQLGVLVSFVLNAVNSNVLSQIADDIKNCDRQELQRRVTSYTKIIFVLSLFAISGLVLCGYPITMLYGEQYAASYFIFCILMVGQIVNVLSGCVATILNMAGHERKTCTAFYIALFINIFFGVFSTYYYGVYGLAVTSSISMIYWNLHLLYSVVTKVGINPTIFIRRNNKVSISK